MTSSALKTAPWLAGSEQECISMCESVALSLTEEQLIALAVTKADRTGDPVGPRELDSMLVVYSEFMADTAKVDLTPSNATKLAVLTVAANYYKDIKRVLTPQNFSALVVHNAYKFLVPYLRRVPLAHQLQLSVEDEILRQQISQDIDKTYKYSGSFADSVSAPSTPEERIQALKRSR